MSGVLKRLLPAALILLVCCVLAWGLAGAFAATPSPSPTGGKNVLRVGWIMDPDSLSPFILANRTAGMICSLNYDVLVGLDAATLSPKKGADATGLATDWSVGADGKTWTFTLRHGAIWQDGHGPVTVDDVAFTINYAIDNEMAAFATYLQGIRRATASDEYTLRIDCTAPKADMLAALNGIPILPQHVWSKVPPKAAATSYPNDPPVVGSGPFQCVAFKKNGYARMVANKSYWRGAPKIDEVVFEFFANADSMGKELEAGTIDACYQLQYALLGRTQIKPGVTAREVVVNGYDDLVLNCYDPPPGGRSLGNPVLRDWRFRQALQYAVDREKLVAAAYAGHGRPGDTVLTPDYSTDPDWHWTPPSDQTYSFDLAKAGQLLDAAGYRDSDGDGVRDYRGKPIRLRLWAMTEYPTSVRDVKLIAVWLRELGLKIDVENLEMANMYERIFNTEDGKLAPDFDLCQSGWYLGVDPGQSLSFFTSGQIGGWNDSAFSNEEFDRLYVQQSRTLDVAQRKKLVDRMQQIVYEQSPYIVLVYFPDSDAWNDKWVGWVPSPAKDGSAVMSVDSYLFVHPRTAGATTSGDASLPVLLVLAGVAAVVGGAVVLRRRRRAPTEE